MVRTAALEPRAGLTALLAEARVYGWRLAVASSSPAVTLRLLLARFHIDRYFETVLSSESVAQGKPAPDIYEQAALRLGTDTSRIVAIEDSLSGLQSAKQAGLKCVVVPHRLTRDSDSAGCDLRVEQLTDLTHFGLLSLIKTDIVYVPKSETGYCSVLYSAIRNSRQDDPANVTLKKPRKDEDLYAQIEKLDEVAENPPDALILVAIDDHPDIRRILNGMVRAGTVIVTVDQFVDLEAEAGSGRLPASYSVSADCLVGGELAAKVLLDRIGRKGAVAVVSGPRDLKPSKDRRLGFLGYIGSYAPHVYLQRVEYTNWYRDEGAEAAKRFINEGIDLQGIFCCCDNLAIEVANVYQDAQRSGRIDAMPAIVGFDGIPEVYDYILDDRILATIDVRTAYQGRVAFSATLGDAPRRLTSVEPKLLTKADIKRDRGRTRCFISYSRADSDIAQALFARLSQAGFQVFVDTQRITGGEKFVERYRDEIANSHVFLALLSPEAVKSDYVRDELKLAVSREARRALSVIPIRLRGEYEIPGSIQDHTFLEVSSETGPVDDGQFRALVRAIDRQHKLIG